MTALAVAVAGAVGALLRWRIGMAVGLRSFPWATLAVNVVGCFLMGLLVARGGMWTSPAVTTGLLGGFTSFSGWVLDVMRLAEPAPLLALTLLVVVPVATVAACVVGLVAGGEAT